MAVLDTQAAPPMAVTATHYTPSPVAPHAFPVWIKVFAIAVSGLKAIPLVLVGFFLSMIGSATSELDEAELLIQPLLRAAGFIIFVLLLLLVIQVFGALASRKIVFLASAGAISLVDLGVLFGAMRLIAETNGTMGSWTTTFAVIAGQFAMFVGVVLWNPGRITTR